MMQKRDNAFVQSLIDSKSRFETIRGWRLSRICSLVVTALCFALTVITYTDGQAAMCGLFSGIAAINFAVVVSTDQKIKFALLIDELSQKVESSGV